MNMAQSKVEACEDELAARNAEIEALQVHHWSSSPILPPLHQQTPAASLCKPDRVLWRRKISAAEDANGSSSGL